MKIDDLVEQISSGSAMVFVGAGVSLGAKLPSWQGLLQRMLEWGPQNGVSISKTDMAELRNHIKRGDLLLVAEEMSERLTPEKYQRFMHEVFTETCPEPTAAHKLIAGIPFSLALTSNYDTLLETAFGESLNTRVTVYTHTDIFDLLGANSRKAFFVFKVHGDINRMTTVVLGRTDYRKLIHANEQYRRALQLLFSTRTALFIGFGLTDPDLLLLLEELRETFKGYLRTHYALMDTRTCSGIMRRRFEKDYGISIIPYTSSTNKHPEIETFLRKLRNQVKTMKAKLRDDEEAKSKKSFETLMKREGAKYELRDVKRDEIPALRVFCAKFLGDDISPLTQMTEWYDKNPTIFSILLEARSGGKNPVKDIVGYYSVIPLNKEAANLIHDEKITGAMFTVDHIVPKGKKPAAIYIGGIAAEPHGKARAIVIGSIAQQLSDARRSGIPIYSRPITKEGLNILHSYNFIPVNYATSSLNHVHKLISLAKMS
jgi:hypothetical protein